MELFAFLLVASISTLACAKSYHVSESYVGNDFYRGFDFQAITERVAHRPIGNETAR